MTKYSKIWANGTKKVPDDEVIPWIDSSKLSDQKIQIMAGQMLAMFSWLAFWARRTNVQLQTVRVFGEGHNGQKLVQMNYKIVAIWL